MSAHAGTGRRFETPATARRTASLGLGMATALVIGNMIASGVFLLPSSLAPYGGLSIIGWLVTGVGAMLLALVFARLSASYPAKGGPYAYARRGFGDFVGFLTAWGYWIAAWVGNAAIAIAFAGYLGYFFPAVSRNAWLAALVALAAIWVLTWVNVVGVRTAGVVQSVTTVLKLIPLLLVGIVGLFSLSSTTFSPFNPTGGSWFSGVTAAALLTLWAFIGVESATVPADEVKDPVHTVPRATIIGTALTSLVYIVGTVGVMAVIPATTLAGSTAPFADAAKEMFGSWGGGLIAIGALISTFGGLNGWILLQGQVPQAAADDGLFPKAFARTTAQGTPWVGLVVSSLLMTLLMATNYGGGSVVTIFTQTIILATLATLVPYLISAAAQLKLLVTEPETVVGGRLWRDGTIALLAIAYSSWLIVGGVSDWTTLMWGLGLFALGAVVYLVMKRFLPQQMVARPAPAPEVTATVPAGTLPHPDDQPLPGDRTVLEVMQHEAPEHRTTGS